MSSSTFSQELEKRLPPSLSLPAVLIKAMDWLEANGGRQTERNGKSLDFEDQSLALYPIDDWTQPGTTLSAFDYYGPFYLNGGPRPVADEDQRVFLFLRTGGDGSYAGLWLDDAGKQQIVHHGSGSGSDWWGVISDDPADLLRLIAIGYEEPAFREIHTKTAQEAALEMAGFDSLFEMAHIMAEAQSAGAEDPEMFHRRKEQLAQEFAARLERGEDILGDTAPCVPPKAFEAFLRCELGIDTPDRASDVLKPRPDHQDPFALWLQTIAPPMDAEAQAQLDEMVRNAETMASDLDGITSDQAPTLMNRLKGLFG